MSCLGERVTALVDDRLGPGERHRALAHLSDCDGCRGAVDAERRSKDLLWSTSPEVPGDDFTARLLALASPAPAVLEVADPTPGVFPRPGRPASDRPSGAPAATRPAGRPTTGTRSARGVRRRTVVTVAAGSASVLGLSLMGVLALTAAGPGGSGPVVPAVDAYAREHTATTRTVPVGSPVDGPVRSSLAGWAGPSPSSWTSGVVIRTGTGSALVGTGLTGTVPGQGR